jgi:hypothetical protein
MILEFGIAGAGGSRLHLFSLFAMIAPMSSNIYKKSDNHMLRTRTPACGAGVAPALPGAVKRRLRAGSLSQGPLPPARSAVYIKRPSGAAI